MQPDRSYTIAGLVTYNDAAQWLSEEYSGGWFHNWTVLNSAFDNFRRRTELNVNFSGQQKLVNHFGYDSAGRLQSVDDTYHTVAYSYLTNSPLIEQVTFNFGTTNQMTTTRKYDNLNRLLAVTTTTNGSGTAAFASRYALNTASQRTSLTNADDSRWNFDYDALGQVTSGKRRWSDGTIVAGQQFEYGYDDIGNRKFAASGGDQWGANLRYQNYTANSLNQYTQRTVPGFVGVLGSATNTATVTVNNQETYRKGDFFRAELSVNNPAAVWLGVTNVAVLAQGTNDIVTNSISSLFIPGTPESFAYDADGNLTNDGRWAYTWNAENRLVKMESPTNAPSGSKRRLEFAYDYRGRRIWKKVTNLDTSATSERRFFHDGWNVIKEIKENGGTVRDFMWGPGPERHVARRGRGGRLGAGLRRKHGGGIRARTVWRTVAGKRGQGEPVPVPFLDEVLR